MATAARSWDVSNCRKRGTGAAHRDLLSLSAKTRISQLRSRQIGHRLCQGAIKAMGDISEAISVALKLY